MRRPNPALIVAAFVALATAALSNGVRAESEDERKKACANPDLRSRVVGSKFCFAIHTYGAELAGPTPILAVVLHGDMSKGGPPKYHLDIAKALVAIDVVAVG